MVRSKHRSEVRGGNLETGPVRSEGSSRSPRFLVLPRWNSRELGLIAPKLDALGRTEAGLKRLAEGLKMYHEHVDGLCLAGKYHQEPGTLQDSAILFQQVQALDGERVGHPDEAIRHDSVGLWLNLVDTRATRPGNTSTTP